MATRAGLAGGAVRGRRRTIAIVAEWWPIEVLHDPVSAFRWQEQHDSALIEAALTNGVRDGARHADRWGGATGGVGRPAVQLAHVAGATVTVTVSSPARADQLSGFGWLRTATIGEAAGPYDLIVDLVGGEALSRALAVVEHDGVVSTIAQTAPHTATIPLF